MLLCSRVSWSRRIDNSKSVKIVKHSTGVFELATPPFFISMHFINNRHFPMVSQYLNVGGVVNAVIIFGIDSIIVN